MRLKFPIINIHDIVYLSLKNLIVEYFTFHSSLELPYKTKLEAQKESERNNAVNVSQDKIRKVLKNRASKTKTSKSLTKGR